MPARDRDLPRRAQAGAAGSAGPGDHPGPADREEFRRRARHRRPRASPRSTRRRGSPRALAAIGRPAILKTRRFGYDGKGQVSDPRRQSMPQAAWQRARRAARDPGGVRAVRARGLGGGRTRARRRGRMLRRAPRTSIATTSSSISRVPAAVPPSVAGRGAPDRGADRRPPSTMSACWRSRCSWSPTAAANAAGQRDRAAGAQFRPLDHRRRDRVAVRAAHPRGRRLAARQAAAARAASR